MNYAANFWHILYKSNFYSRSYETQKQFESAMKQFLDEYEKDKNKQ
jgi:hypothetical protein